MLLAVHLCMYVYTHDLSILRSPNEHSRPSFRDIHLSLSQNQEHVLQIPEEAASTHPQAAVLGAPLEAGEKMYMDLQNSYF